MEAVGNGALSFILSSSLHLSLPTAKQIISVNIITLHLISLKLKPLQRTNFSNLCVVLSNVKAQTMMDYTGFLPNK